MILKKWDIEYEVIDLKEYGINNIAFDLPSAVSYMYEAVNKGFLILGGDIIISSQGKFFESDDNWYSNKKIPMDTMQDALNYLSRYWKNCNIKNSEWYITVVLG